MHSDEDDFRQRYAELNDEALLSLDREELTDLARQCYDDELASRHLKREPGPTPHAAAPDPVDDDMLPAQTYSFLDEAEVAQSFLRSAGIPCYLENQNMLRMIWTWSYVLGGFRLRVPASLLLEAQEILAATCSQEELLAAIGTQPPVGDSNLPARLRGRTKRRTAAFLVYALLFGSLSVDQLQLIYVFFTP